MDVSGNQSSATQGLATRQNGTLQVASFKQMSFAVSYLAKLVLVLLLPLSLISCTEGTPEFTDLGSEFSAPSFDELSGLYIIDSLTADSPAISGTCDDATVTIGTKPQGATVFDDVATFSILPSSDLDCRDGRFSIVLDEAGNYMGFTSGIAAQRTLTIRTQASNGDSTEGEVTIRYLPEIPRFSVEDLPTTSVSEGSSVTLRISITPQATFGALIDYTTTADTAGGSDFTSASGSVSFGAGEDFVSITIPVTLDLLYEGAESFSFDLSNPVGANLSIASGAVTIGANGVAPLSFIDPALAAEGDDLNFLISLSEVSGVDAVVSWQSFDGNATSPQDFMANSGFVTIPAGSTSSSFLFYTVEDSLFEAAEGFTVSITSVSDNTVSVAAAPATITNDDAAPIVYIDDLLISEDTTGTFSVSLNEVSGIAVTLSYQTYDIVSQAVAGSDYTASSGTITIGAGLLSDSSSITVAALPVDALVEGNETFLVSLAVLSGGADIASSDLEALGSILDNETPNLFVVDTGITEGLTEPVFVSLSQAAASEVTFAVELFTVDAEVGDYTAIGTGVSLTIPSGLATTAIPIVTANDTIYENDEVLVLSISNASNAAIAKATGSVTIADNDAPPLITILGDSVLENVTPQVLVSLSAISEVDVTFDYTSFAGTATVGEFNFIGDSSIVAGSDLVTVAGSVVNDTAFELTDTFQVSLFNVSAANVAALGTADIATVSILNDDSEPLVYATVLIGVSEGAAPVIAISISAVSAVDTVVDFVIAQVGAVSLQAEPGDYSFANLHVTIPYGYLFDSSSRFTV
ncbi:MAG: hypothetical protein HRT45_11695, partial [Bdellovibrionales bacterium]|nr:hypothetical protein [Bdellovibrionales bacterium]